MKAFRFEKVSDRSEFMFRAFKETFEKHYNPETDKLNTYNCIEIFNPISSGHIYEIKEIKIKFNNDAVVYLLMGNSSYKTENKTGKPKDLSFTYLIYDEITGQHTEINSVKTESLKDLNLIQGYYILLLPGGSLYIRSDNPFAIDFLSLKWSTEEI